MATNSKSIQKRYGEIGDTGVQIFNGIISGEEYNFNLIGKRALKVWDEMRKSDAQVKMALRVVNEPVKALTYHVQPASDDEVDQQAAELVHENLFTVLRWKTTLSEVLTHLPMGFAVFEKVLTYGPVKGTDRVYLQKLAFRKQTSISKWDAGDGVPGVTQTKSDGASIGIPLERLAVFTNEQEGDNYEGVSVLRSAYKHWYYKDKLYQIDAIGHERQGLGVVKIKHPKNAKPAQIEMAHKQARALRAAEEGFIDEPEGWEVGFMDMQAKTLKESTPSIEHHNRQIPVSMLAGFMDLGGTSGSGSRAVGETQLKMFEFYVKSVADYIVDTMNRYVVKEIVDLNFNVTEYPKLVAGEVSGESLTELATALKNLIDAGAIVPTEEDEAYLRGIMRLPERPDDENTEDQGKKAGDKKNPAVKDDPSLEDEEDAKKASLVERARSVLASLKEKLRGDSSTAS